MLTTKTNGCFQLILINNKGIKGEGRRGREEEKGGGGGEKEASLLCRKP